MKLVHVDDIPRPPDQGVLARPLLDGSQSSVRIIRLAPGQTLPPHRHGASDLMLYVAAGEGQLDEQTAFSAGSLASYTGDEELRVRNVGSGDLVLLAFLAPPLG